MIVKCHTGLGGRVTAIANGLAMAGSIQFHWFANAHCPLHHREVFPNGIPNVRFVEGNGIECITIRDGKSLDRYNPQAASHYSVIMDAMAGKAWDKPKAAIVARFQRHPGASIEPLIQAAQRSFAESVYLLADSRRREISSALLRVGISSTFPKCRELPSDLSRSRCETIALLSDWKTALSASLIIAIEPSGMLHPAFAAETPVSFRLDSQAVLQ